MIWDNEMVSLTLMRNLILLLCLKLYDLIVPLDIQNLKIYCKN